MLRSIYFAFINKKIEYRTENGEREGFNLQFLKAYCIINMQHGSEL